MKYLGITAAALTIALFSTNAKADQVDRDVLNAGGLARYTHFLPAHETTVFTVVGDGSSDIDCYLYDENSNEVARDTRVVDGCVVYVVPRWSGRFTFMLRNNGRQASAYRYFID